jgi:hypothetical protein
MASIIGAQSTESGELTWHAAAALTGNYHTLCGLSLDDDLTDPVAPERGQKITCHACKVTHSEASKFKLSDFESE